MKASVIILTPAVAVTGPGVSAQTVDQPMADRPLLNAELEPYKQLAMASVDDIRCISAAARSRRSTCQ